MRPYNGYNIFVENTSQAHSSMKAYILTDRFINVIKSIVASISPCKTTESLRNIEVSWSNYIIVVYIHFIQLLQILQENLHTTHILKLLDMMYKYEMDPTIWNGSNQNFWRYRADTGCGTDGRMGRRTGWNQYNPHKLRFT